MTNTIFHNIIRDYASSSSFSSLDDRNFDQTPQHDGTPEAKVETASSFGKACLAWARGSIQPKQQYDDSSTTAKDTQKLSSKLVSPTSQSSTFKRFNFAKLRTATKNFQQSDASKGSISSLFEAWVDGHELTATKHGRGCIAVCVKVFNQDGLQNQTEFLGRVNSLAHVEHPNLVRLLGYGLEDTQRLLVYELTSRRSLEDHLFERPSQNFTWSLRMKVALDAAKGLAFLHSFENKVIHGYFNPSNILVDSNYNAKLSGFGLTKDRPTAYPEEVMDGLYSDYSLDSSTIHDAPEYRYTGQFSAKSDVYSFGVVLLELLCGRRAFEGTLGYDEKNLIEWTNSHSSYNFRIFEVLDSHTAGQYSKNAIQKAVKLTVTCLPVQANLRPTMDKVVHALEELQI